jgi:hypothetical protein
LKLIALLWTHVLDGVGVLLAVEHAAMLACMLIAMLLRRAEYGMPCGGR